MGIPNPLVLPTRNPDFAIELNTCFSALDPVLQKFGITSSDLEQSFRTSLQTSFQTAISSIGINPLTNAIVAKFPSTPAVGFTCSKLAHEVIGIWLATFVHSPTQPLNALSILPPGKVFAIGIPANTIQSFIDSVWALLQTTGGRVNSDSAPDSTAPTQITQRPSLTSPTSNSLKLSFKGIYHNTQYIRMDIDFTYSTVETLTVNAGGGVVSTVKTHLDMDLAEVRALEVFLALLTAPVPALIEFYESQIEEAIGAGEEQVPSLPAIGALLASFIPNSYPIDFTQQKLVVVFDQISCDMSTNGTGLTISGTNFAFKQRTPIIAVTGSLDIVINRYSDNSITFSKTYTAVTVDFTTISSFAWTENGQPLQSTVSTVEAVFDVTGMKTGDTREVPFKVSAADNGGLSASTSFLVTIKIVYEKSVMPQRGGILKNPVPNTRP